MQVRRGLATELLIAHPVESGGSAAMVLVHELAEGPFSDRFGKA
jgi:hypothetical protein